MGTCKENRKKKPKKVICSSDNPAYAIKDKCLCFLKDVNSNGKPVYFPLCNFVAQCIEEVLRDDGREAILEFVISGTLNNGTPLAPVTIKASDFAGMGWIPKHWGIKAMVSAGSSLRDKLRVAIQLHSQDAPKRKIYAHTGWRKIDGVWVFLHGGGAIGSDGLGVEVDLGTDLGRYRLPMSGDLNAAQASLRFLEITPWEITAPIIASIYLATLSDVLGVNFTLWIHGRTGSYKSSLIALALSHFGDFDLSTLPGQWSSTANALEHRAFILKDMPFVIDDFSPGMNRREAQGLEEKAHRVLRATGNRAGRQRLTSDLSAAQTYYPRCLVISTGELLPSGHSIVARSFTVEMQQGQVSLAKLSQGQSAKALYSQAMSAFLAWLAPQIDELKTEIQGTVFPDYRARFQAAGHPRLPEAQAWLQIGFELFTRFLGTMGAISEATGKDMNDRAWEVFRTLGERHSQVIEKEKPALKALSVLRDLLFQGNVYVSRIGGGPSQIVSEMGGADIDPPRDREFIGWEGNGDGFLYLRPDPTFQAIQKAMKQREDFLGLKKNGLLKALAGEGIIQSSPKEEHTQPKTIEGKSHRVLCLFSDRLLNVEES